MIENADVAHVVHYVFEWLGLAVGVFMFQLSRRKGNLPTALDPGMFSVVVGALIGAALGNKASFWFEYSHLWVEQSGDFGVWVRGQSIVGGLLGGWTGVEIGKRVGGVTSRTGDSFVPSILVGLCIGRVGCFLAGLHDGTYGIPTELPWGIDFGDGLHRHPTQLYECIFTLLGLAAWRQWRMPLTRTPGLGFRIFMLIYLSWRLGIDSIKPTPYAYALGLSGIQWICVFGLCVIVLGLVLDGRKVQNG